MRAIVILIAVAILGFFGYQYAANGNTPAEAISALSGTETPVAVDAASETAEDAGDMVVDTTQEAAADLADAGSDMTQSASATAEGTAADAADLADDAASAVAQAAEDASDMAANAGTAAADMANDAVAAVGNAVDSVTEGATDMANDAAAAVDAMVAPEAPLDIPTPKVQVTPQIDAVAEPDATIDPISDGMANLLTPEGFDADKVAAMIDGSDLSAVQKTVLSGAVNAVKSNPDLLDATLTRLKEALGQ
jgi:hypothetical protein